MGECFYCASRTCVCDDERKAQEVASGVHNIKLLKNGALKHQGKMVLRIVYGTKELREAVRVAVEKYFENK